MNIFDEVDESVNIINDINSIERYLTDGDSILYDNYRLASKSYDKALEISERLLGISVIDEEDVSRIRDRVILSQTLLSVDLIKSVIVDIIGYINNNGVELYSIINRLREVDFNKMSDGDMVHINDLISKVLKDNPLKLGELINSINTNPTNINTFNIKLS